MTARYASSNSKSAETVFSTSTAMGRTKGTAKFPTLVHLTRRLFWTKRENQAWLDRVDANNKIFWAASTLGRLHGWVDVFGKNMATADVMYDNAVSQDPKKLPAGIKNGSA